MSQTVGAMLALSGTDGTVARRRPRRFRPGLWARPLLLPRSDSFQRSRNCSIFG